MEYLKVDEVAKKWGISSRMVRNYCQKGRVFGAVLKGKTWFVPKNATKPTRQGREVGCSLLDTLRQQKSSAMSGGIYHKIQVELTYNSNHIEGSTLTHQQTQFIFETNTIGIGEAVNVDDIVETANHFRCIDYVIDNAQKKLSEKIIKDLHFMLKSGTSDARKSWFGVGEYKKLPNEVGGQATTDPKNVGAQIRKLLESYNAKTQKTLEDIVEFHWQFEKIHPFQDGNGRIGRLLMFKECLANDIVPFVITEKYKMFYYRGLAEWQNEHGFLLETCRFAQDIFQKWLDYFEL